MHVNGTESVILPVYSETLCLIIYIHQEKISGEPGDIIAGCHRSEHQPSSHILRSDHTAHQHHHTGKQVRLAPTMAIVQQP